MLKLRGIPSSKPVRENGCIKKVVLPLTELVYILSPLPKYNAALDEINNMFYSFLWSRRGDKIKRDVMISDYKNGGLRMIDIKYFNKALKTKWVQKYLDNHNHGKWKLFFDSELHDFGGVAIFKGNLSKKRIGKVYTYIRRLYNRNSKHLVRNQL